MVKAGIALSVTLLVVCAPSPSHALQVVPGGRGAPGARGTPPAPQGDLVDALLRLPTGQPVALRGQAPQYTRESPPPDDAPLDVLGRFWASEAQFGGARTPRPSDKTRERLVQAVIEQPALATSLLNLLPQTTAVHDRMKKIYDEQRRSAGTEWNQAFRAYLMRHTPYLREELVREASAAADHAQYASVEQAEQLEMLAAADFRKAEPILKKFAADPMPRRAVLAKALLFEFGPSGPDLEALNAELRKIVVDTTAFGASRDRAVKALVAREWPGREEWFLDLFRQSSLMMVRDTVGLRSPLCQHVWSDQDRWVPVLVKFVGNADRAVHDNAVQCLSQFASGRETYRPDALEPLLPWLFDPKWSSAYENISPSGRLRLIQSVAPLGFRQSIPGLISVLSQGAGENYFDMSYRSYAAEALGRFKAAEAAPALRQALASTTGTTSGMSNTLHRRRMMTALVEVGGIPDAEVVAALEGYAGMLGRSGPQSMMLALGGFGGGGSSVSDEVLMGQLLAASQTAPSEAAIERVISRAEELRATDAATATQLLEIVHRWPSAAGDRDIARRIADNTAQATNIRLALQHRDKFRENAADAVRDSVASSGFPAGIFAVFSGDRQRVESILKGTDIAAIRALFASARLAGEALPFDVVERVFNSGDANVERTAQAYLVSNDGPGARKVLNARYKGTVIFGDGESDDDSGSPADSVFGRQEQQLLTRMRGADAPDEVFALFGFTGSAWSNTTNTDQIVIERHGDKATLRSQGNRVGRSNRTLSAEEFGRLKTFIDSENVEDLGPISAMVSDITLLFEYVHLTKSSGRRVYMNNLGFGNTAGSVHDKLVAEFLRVVQPR